MEGDLIIILVALVTLVLLDIAAIKFGFDSRDIRKHRNW